MNKILAVFACLLLMGAGVARADYLDLTASLSATGAFGPAIFSGQFDQPVGTGVFDPFWRANSPGSTTSYEFFNTDYRPLDGDLVAGNNANGPDITNRTFLVNTLQAVNGYYVFILDTDEPNNAAQAVISMDKFVIRTSSSNTLHTFAALSAANLVYDIDTAGACVATGGGATCISDTSNGVLITEALNPGSGKTNLVAQVPTYLFTHPDEYLYLDVQFGARTGGEAQDGFEEWSALRGANFVPDGGVTLMLLGGALVGIETLRRKVRA